MLYKLLTMTSLPWESWFKIGLPALPTFFSIFGAWLGWGRSPVPLLAPNVAFWGVVISFYLFTYMYRPTRRTPFFVAVGTALCWFAACCYSMELSKIVESDAYKTNGVSLVFGTRFFYLAYLFALTAFVNAMRLFVHHEPRIVRHQRSQ